MAAIEYFGMLVTWALGVFGLLMIIMIVGALTDIIDNNIKKDKQNGIRK